MRLTILCSVNQNQNHNHNPKFKNKHLFGIFKIDWWAGELWQKFTQKLLSIIK